MFLRVLARLCPNHQVVIGVGLNLGNEEPSTCIDALLRAEHQRRTGGQDSSLSVSPEARAHSCQTLLIVQRRRGPAVTGQQPLRQARRACRALLCHCVRRSGDMLTVRALGV